MYKLIKLAQADDDVSVTMDFNAITLQEMLQVYSQFLRASGFYFDGELEIIEFVPDTVYTKPSGGDCWPDDTEIANLQQENANLRAIIAKELSENDDFGSEFVITSILKEEIAKLRDELASQNEIYKKK
jgi:hypothetical protein